jgi:DNA-directed RNA polymerase subunit RPC12/RpoP
MRKYFIVSCSKCGHEKLGLKINNQRLSTCPGCSEKPAAIKTDEGWLSICTIGKVVEKWLWIKGRYDF